MRLKVFSKPDCSRCDQAKAILGNHAIPFEVVMLDTERKKQEFLIVRTLKTKLMPIIELDGEQLDLSDVLLRNATGEDFLKVTSAAE